MLLGQSADAADRTSASRRVGIDTRFGDLVREGTKQQINKNYVRAIALYNEALAMQPDPTNAAILYMQRGSANLEIGRHAAALADYDKSRQLRPGEPLAHNDAAWLRATAPDAALRNGKLAVQQATRACELAKWKHPFFIDTLAAAYAETGEFDRAVQLQKKAISFAPLSERNKMRERLRLFENRTPFRLTATQR